MKYPHVVKSWRNNWEGLTVFFGYPKDIRKVIYTTNAIESLNSVIRTAVNKRKVFPSESGSIQGSLPSNSAGIVKVVDANP